MAEMIHINQVGSRLDRDLKSINDVQNEDNNDKILYIRRGEIDLDTYENLFTIVKLE